MIKTGSSTIQDIETAVNAITSQGNNKITLLQCTAKYSTPLQPINLNSLPFLKEKFNLQIGLSDHSRDPIVAPVGALYEL